MPQDLNSLYTALQNAHKAGDTAAATKLATYLKSLQGPSPEASAPATQPPASPAPTNPGNANVGSEYAMGPFGPGLSTTMGVPAAAQVGTPQNSSAPYGLRNRLSLEVNPSNQQIINDVNQSVGNNSGAIGPQGPQFTAPGANNPTLVNPPNLPFSNIPTVGGTMDTVLSGLGSTLASGAAGLITKNPLAAWGAGVAGAGAGQEVSNEGKNLLAKFFNKDPMTGQQQIEDLKSAGSTALWAAPLGAIGLLPSIGNFANRGALGLGSIKNLERVYNASINARDGLNDFYELLGNSKFDPSIGELLPNEVTLSKKFDAASRAGDVRLNGEFSGPYILDIEYARKLQNVNSLANAYDNITIHYMPNEGYASPEGSYEAANLVAAQRGVQQNQLKLARDQAFNAAQQQATPLSRFQIGKNAVDALQAVKQAGKDAVNQAWGRLNTLLGVPQDEAFGGEPYWQSLKNMPRIGFSNTTKARLTELWNRGMSAMRNTQTGTPEAGSISQGIFDSIPDELYNDAKDPTQGLIFDNPNKEYSPNLKWYTDGVKALRAGLRRSVRPGFNPDTLTQMNVAKILRGNIDDWFSREGDPRILNALEEAEQTTQDFHQKFSQGILDQVDNQEAGQREPIYNQFASKVLIGGNEDELSRLANVTKNSPYAQNQMRLGIWSLLHEGVSDATSANTLASRFQSMKGKLAPAIKNFFGQDDLNSLNSFEQMTNKVDQLNEQYKGFVKDWRNSDFADIPATVSGIRTALYNKNMPVERAGKLYNFLSQNNPALLKMVGADMAKALAARVSNATEQGLIPDATKMTSVLEDKGTQAKVRLFLGGDYLNNVSAIKAAAKTLKPGASPNPEAPQSIFTNLVRWAFAPPLSAEGRLYSGLLQWRHRAAARAIYNALSSPEGLSDFINAAYHRYDRTAALTTLGALGAGSLASQLPTASPGTSTTPGPSGPSGQQTTYPSGTKP